MEMDCIPSGMELFPAADEEQWEFIKRIIDDCDYYLLIIGGRYGSTTPEGISYTEKEYDYAMERGLKVIALLHASPEEIAMGKSETDPELRVRLNAFREKVAKSRLVKFWKTRDELPGLVALSLSKTIKMYPAVGWVRADQITTTELLSEINQLRKRKDELEQDVIRLRASQIAGVTDLAPLDESLVISGKQSVVGNEKWTLTTTWKDLFSTLAPYLLEQPSDSQLRQTLSKYYCEKYSSRCAFPDFDDHVFHTIRIQLEALGLIRVERLRTIAGGMATFWSLTTEGQTLMMSVRVVRPTQVPPPN